MGGRVSTALILRDKLGWTVFLAVKSLRFGLFENSCDNFCLKILDLSFCRFSEVLNSFTTGKGLELGIIVIE